VGLNIVAANHVIHLTRWWNPAVEDQCTDRAYRIGQTKPVTLYLPLSLHANYPSQSFDELLHDMLESKRSIAQGVLMPGETGNEAAELLKKLSQTLDQDLTSREPRQKPQEQPTDIQPDDTPANTEVISLTLYPDELSSLLKIGIRPPDVGLDIAREDDSIFTNLEWAWLDVKAGFSDAPPEEELLQLKRLGWRVVTQADDVSIGKLKDWLQ
jgi:hypothetical protein